MELSISDLSLLENLGRKMAVANGTEVLAAEIHQALQPMARFPEVRVVAAEQPSGWREWIAGSDATGMRECAEFPQPLDRGTVAYFDRDEPETGYLWISTTEQKCRQALQLIAPHAGTAIMLQAALRRS